MLEHQPVAPQGNLLPRNAAPVLIVAPQRRAHVRHLHADLVIPPRLQADGTQRRAVLARKALAGQHRQLRALLVRVADFDLVEVLVLFQVVDASEAVFDAPLDDAEVLAPHLVLPHLRRQPGRRLARARKDHQPANRAIQPMHQPQIHRAGLVVLDFDVLLQLRKDVGVARFVRLREHIRRLDSDDDVVILVLHVDIRQLMQREFVHLADHLPLAPQGSTPPVVTGRQSSCASMMPPWRLLTHFISILLRTLA